MSRVYNDPDYWKNQKSPVKASLWQGKWSFFIKIIIAGIILGYFFSVFLIEPFFRNLTRI
jgi:hypothetical protein